MSPSFPPDCGPIHSGPLPPSSGPRVSADPRAAADGLRAGGVWAFPTETFYGLGCAIFHADAVRRVYQLKRRPVQRPLPVLAGHIDQLAALVRLDEAPAGLLDRFWPGSLTVLLSPLPGLSAALPPQVCGPTGKLAVRVTPHPLTAQLALACGCPLTSSSANLSGQPAARLAADLPPELLAALTDARDGVLDAGPEPRGGLPSSIVDPLPDGRLRLVRAGAVSAGALAEAGFACLG